MFDINIWPLLNTHTGDRLDYQFDGPVPNEMWSDLEIVDNLQFDIELIAIDDGVDTIIRNLTTLARYEGVDYPVSIDMVERTFSKTYDPAGPDDINPIDIKGATVDLGKVLREEILMQIL